MKTFIELKVCPVNSDKIHFQVVMLNINTITCIAPYKQDTDFSVIKCGEKTAYICELPYDEIKKILKEETIEGGSKYKYDNIGDYYV